MDKSSERIRDMFDSIAPKYDTLNHVLSFGIDKGWRRRTVRMVAARRPASVLDVATGTADLAIGMAKKCPEIEITGVDLSPEMLEIGVEKVKEAGFSDRVRLEVQNALNMGFDDGSFDAVTCAFGVRNFEDTGKGLSEFYRVLRNGGALYILEFSVPEKGIFSSLYLWYFRHILPVIGRMVSADEKAYTYLPESAVSFAQGEEFVKLLEKTGFKDIFARKLTKGVATLYTAVKNED